MKKVKKFFNFVEYVRPIDTYFITVSGNSAQRRKGIRQAKRMAGQSTVKIEIY